MNIIYTFLCSYIRFWKSKCVECRPTNLEAKKFFLAVYPPYRPSSKLRHRIKPNIIQHNLSRRKQPKISNCVACRYYEHRQATPLWYELHINHCKTPWLAPISLPVTPIPYLVSSTVLARPRISLALDLATQLPHQSSIANHLVPRNILLKIPIFQIKVQTYLKSVIYDS